MMEISVKLGKKIRKMRESKGYSQEKFAELVGVHRTYMGSIERGEKNITIVTARKISDALNIDLTDLIKGI